MDRAHAKRLWILGCAAIAAACGVAFWPHALDHPKGGESPPKGEEKLANGSTVPPNKFAIASPKAQAKRQSEFLTAYTIERLCQEHERPPSEEEWPELTRILLQSMDEEMVSAVKARFALYAGTKELAVLVDAYDTPANDEVRQRVIEVFSALQSGTFMEAARRILTNVSLPITDQLVNACAISLARRGEQGDVEAIFKRLSAAGEDPEPKGSLYSDADGLVGAIGVLHNPALERMLCDVAAGHGIATTNRARAAAANALRNYHTVSVTEILYGLSKSASDPMVKARAADSLRVIQTPE